ncbi:MAG: hypothetical protein HQK79_22665 [Desulfobacterales bacterium]|nr:hypothetical protein [Desulfobacterales bacterium]
MKLSEISKETLETIKSYRYDHFVEKHEGPWEWDFLLEDNSLELLNINGYNVLLPIEKEHHKNVIILRCIVSEDKEFLTIFLKDTTFYEGVDSGFIAICKKVPDEKWYISIVYHEWMLTDYEIINFQ